jgi:hypothetical protein
LGLTTGRRVKRWTRPVTPRRDLGTAGVDIAGPVSKILDYPPATADDLREAGARVRAEGVRWLTVAADQRDVAAIRDAAAGKQPSGDPKADEKTAAELLAGGSPLGVPWIDPADMAPVVAFLASDEARMVSGATYAVTAGDSAHFTA